MKNKTIGIVAGAILILVAGVFVVMQMNKTEVPTPQQENVIPAPITETVTEPVVNEPKAKGFTMAQVAEHKDATSCWSAVSGTVYDLTSWISEHPGGERQILGICGKDGTSAFNRQHEGKQKQADILAGFQIGPLVQ
jgi:cytochrome b involved in lipid metabolism